MTTYSEEFKKGVLQRLNEEVRSTIIRQSGQLLFMPDSVKINSFLSAAGIENVTSGVIDKSIIEGTKKAKELSRNYRRSNIGKLRYNRLIKRIENNTYTPPSGFVLDENLFLVSSYRSSIDRIITTIIKELTLNPQESIAFRKAFQKGHGESGLAVAQVQVAESIKSLPPTIRAEAINGFKAYINTADLPAEKAQKYIELINQIEQGYLSLVTRGAVIKNVYFSEISFQLTGDNQSDKEFEAGLVRFFKEFVESEKGKIKIVNSKNSPSLVEKLSGLYVNTIVDNLTKNKRVKTKKAKNIKLGTIDKSSKTDKVRNKKQSINIKPKPYGPIVNIKKDSKPLLNLNALKAQINARLSMTVIKNMGTPALENRTGRFARSAIVTDVVQTSQGFPSIGYTYQKYPYQTFEPGFKQGSVQRDPRTLIDRSIREIATQLIVGRFYTRRV